MFSRSSNGRVGQKRPGDRGSVLPEEEENYDTDEDTVPSSPSVIISIPNSVQRSKMNEEIRRPSILKGKKNNSIAASLQDFEIKMLIGKGSFGKVFLAELPMNGKKYAIKVIRKDKLIHYDQIQSTALEKDILFQADHPFLCGMEYLFQSEARLYFVMPFESGGELYKIVKKRKVLDEATVKFYAT